MRLGLEFVWVRVKDSVRVRVRRVMVRRVKARIRRARARASHLAQNKFGYYGRY